jgi:phenylacetic acid degradation operon negative regulatory protein
MKDSDLIFGLMASFQKASYSFDDLYYLAAPFSMTKPSLRTNLSRMAAGNLILSCKEGRSAFYQFAEKGQRISKNVMHGFTALNWDHWDHTYWGVTFSVPEKHSASRHYIRKKLTLYRFACLNPGLWIRPAHPNENIPEIFGNILSDGFCRLIRFTNQTEFTPEQIAAMWNLEEVSRQMSAGLVMLAQAEQEVASLSVQQALVSKMTVGEAAVRIISSDPMLPPLFLPSNWEGETIRERFKRFAHLATALSKPYWVRIYEGRKQHENR